MRRGADVRAIRKVQEVRLVQRMAAELAVGRAGLALVEAEAERGRRAEQLDQDQAAWAQSMTARPFGLEVALAWSAEVLKSQAGLIEADAEAREAAAEKDRKAGDWRGALAREDAADDVARTLFGRVRRAREEALLNELADRAARRSGRP